MVGPVVDDPVEIREVWQNNIEEEFNLIRDNSPQHPYIGLDTEFPGTVARAVGDFVAETDRWYQDMKLNVESTKLIQLGITLSDAHGNLPRSSDDKPVTWQFNFRDFNPDEDVEVEDSIQFLASRGVDFKKNVEHGASLRGFKDLMLESGLLRTASFQWITFQGLKDLGYLLRLLTGSELPETKENFMELVRDFFPVVYDLKHMMKFAGYYGGLDNVSWRLGVQRAGQAHQAGSDSHATVLSFLRIKEHFGGAVEIYNGRLHGLF